MFLKHFCTKGSTISNVRRVLPINNSHFTKIAYRTITNTPYYLKSKRSKHQQNKVEVNSLEDLVKFDSLDDVDPAVIKKLIDEKTQELNLKDELKMLKDFQENEKSLTNKDIPLKKFWRPFWIFLLLSSSVYLTCHYFWWKYMYEEREIDLQNQVNDLEFKLKELMRNANINGELNTERNVSLDNSEEVAAKKRWFWNR
ncbi:Ina17p NDAI_0E02640 [Naumovozyma dairenensis CBS 421]|uniref:Inner membrane assembly complex subunit 17 n=1 Tax=Naumovozyma dairenensis (strain ATCC 10597 / BCRC 20456 / CBS 421 / NBRC 0211 / NRRL Y-12639) TaxID=1071378 RepID=G0WBG1_NAUDC|nr:hypothetical protein NDAI_0E02640 [Naumovozyma dairenensis CBS 421]CCD25081.1 hypothetical protein NDAI_0E02640 [Naumovozyma dairenensis CBS 421]